MNKEKAIEVIMSSVLAHLDDPSYVKIIEPKSKEALGDLVSSLGKPLKLGQLGNQLISDLQESIRIIPYRAGMDEIPLGASRFGGVPDLPRGFMWPVRMARLFKSYENEIITYHNPVPKPLMFLAQIRCADLPKIDANPSLPDRGFYYFFYGVDNINGAAEDPDSWKVFYYDIADNQLERAEQAPADNEFPSHLCRLEFSTEFTTYLEYMIMADIEIIHGESDFFDELAFLKQRLRDEEVFDEDAHRMLGHPDYIQGDNRASLEFIRKGLKKYPKYGSWKDKSLHKGAVDWIPLLQLSSDPNDKSTGWMWGDCGSLFFWIYKKYLAAGHLENILTQFESL